jgi:hypothetical protein
MRFPRAALGALTWVLAAVVGLLGALLCVTLIGLPLGIPLLRWARRMFTTAVRLMLPSHLAHPVKESKSAGRRRGRQAASKGKEATQKTSKTSRELASRGKGVFKRASSAVPEPSGKKATKRGRKKAKRLREALR